MQASAKILLPIGVIALLGLGALVTFGPGPVDEFTPEAPAVGVGAESEAVDPDPGAAEEIQTSVELQAQREDPKPLIDPSSGKGLISGRIAVNTRVIDKVSAYTVVVQEDVNTNGRKATDPVPFFKQVVFKADFSRGTPYFDIEDIPFSRHPYKVSVIAKGVNGSSQHTYVTAESPNGSNGDVQLSLTPGAYFSILLRDQRQNPRGHLPVRMTPIGESLVARDTLIGKSDGRGYLLFEDVVKGEYEIRVGPVRAPLAPPTKIKIYTAFPMFDRTGRPKTQGTIVVVPDGEDVTIEVWSRYGYPVENAGLTAWQLEITRFYDFEGTTDRAGRFIFENVPYGTYQLTVKSPKNGIKTLKFKVEKTKPSPIVKVTMSR